MDRRQKSEDRKQKSEFRSQESESGLLNCSVLLDLWNSERNIVLYYQVLKNIVHRVLPLNINWR